MSGLHFTEKCVSDLNASVINVRSLIRVDSSKAWVSDIRVESAPQKTPDERPTADDAYRVPANRNIDTQSSTAVKRGHRMTIVLIPGLWLKGSAWDDVCARLETLGHRSVALTLPGQGDGALTATLDDQVNCVVAAIDGETDKVLVVGHSAASSLAWIAADARFEAVSSVVFIGGFPAGDGETYADFVEPVEGTVDFPGWDTFDGPDSVDIDENARRRMEMDMVPVPEAVTKGVVRLRDPRRYQVPATLVCPEFTTSQARQWIDEGQLPELAQVESLQFVDIDSGHWPMYTQADRLARLLASATLVS